MVFSKAKRKELVLNLCDCTKHIRVFHILDSLENHSTGKLEGELVQKLLLKHHRGIPFKEDQISVNLAKAIS